MRNAECNGTKWNRMKSVNLIVLKGALSREFCCFQLHSLLKSLPVTLSRSQNAQMD